MTGTKSILLPRWLLSPGPYDWYIVFWLFSPSRSGDEDGMYIAADGGVRYHIGRTWLLGKASQRFLRKRGELGCEE